MSKPETARRVAKRGGNDGTQNPGWGADDDDEDDDEAEGDLRYANPKALARRLKNAR